MRTYLLALAAVIAIAPSAKAAASYRLVPLGFLPGDAYSDGRGINNLGQVVGYSQSPAYQNRAFLWDRVGGLQNLDPLASSSYAFGINDAGAVVGGNSRGPFRWTAAGGTQLLANAADVGAINNNGWVAGRSTTGHPSVWNESGWMLDLGTLVPEGFGNAYGINDSGVVVGQAQTDIRYGSTYAFIWDQQNGIRRLGSSYLQDTAFDINNNGLVVGSLNRLVGTSVYEYATLWDTNRGTVLDLGGNRGSRAYAINDLSEVVGVNTDGRAFLWTATGGLRELNGLVDATGAGWILSSASGISTRSEIVGVGINPLGQTEAFLLTPIPEPSSLLALLCGLGGVGGAVYRKRR